MKTIQWFLVMAAWIVAVAVPCLGQAADPIATVCATSEELAAYSASIRMTQHQDGGDSEIEFTFDFVPPERMRILYTAPATVNGQTMILNADKFYTYIPALHRSVWQDVGEGGGNQGAEMGFLYDFVTQSAAETLAQSAAEIEEDDETYLLEGTDEHLDVTVLTLSIDDERQVVWLNELDAAPVAIWIYHGEDLVLEIRVLDYELNGPVDEAWFAIPEQ